MATATRTAPTRNRTRGVQAPRRHARPTSEHRLAEARAHEVHAREALAQMLAGMVRANTLAARRLDEFDAYLDDARKRLRRDGYLGAGRSSAHLP
jgi:hypothetical protein